MKALLVFGVAVAAGLGLAERGTACTAPRALTPTEPRAVVAEADAAFTGTLVAVTAKEPRSLNSFAPYVFTFAVEEELKGGLGSRVEVTSSLGGASCGGHDGTIGRRGAYVLSRRDDVWGPWGMTEVTPETLRRGLLPLPNPDGIGPAAFVAGGRFGLVRSAVLDASGRTLHYGYGHGAVTALSVCPGRKVVAELIRLGESVRLALRQLPSLDVVRETEVRVAGFGETVVCRSRDGSDVLAAIAIYGQRRQEAQLVRINAVGSRILETAPSLAFAVRGTSVYATLSDGTLVVRELGSGTRRIVPRVGVALRGMSVSPDGRFVAGFTGETLAVVDLRRGSTAEKLHRGYPVQTRWTGRTTLAAWSRGSGSFELFDPGLRRLQPAWKWPAHTTTLSGADVFGVDWSGGLLTEKDGFIVRLGQVFSAAVAVLAPL